MNEFMRFSTEAERRSRKAIQHNKKDVFMTKGKQKLYEQMEKKRDIWIPYINEKDNKTRLTKASRKNGSILK